MTNKTEGPNKSLWSIENGIFKCIVVLPYHDLRLTWKSGSYPLGQTLCPIPLPQVKFLAHWGPQSTVVSLNAWAALLLRSAKLKLVVSSGSCYCSVGPQLCNTEGR